MDLQTLSAGDFIEIHKYLVRDFAGLGDLMTPVVVETIAALKHLFRP